MSHKTWGGRFSGDTDSRVEAFTESISFDQRLYRHDILASQAHARMLAEVGLLTADEAERIVATLDQIAGEIEARLKEDHSIRAAAIDGFPASQWIVLDYLQVVVHIFHRDKRDFYSLEDLWGDAPRLEVESATSAR